MVPTPQTRNEACRSGCGEPERGAQRRRGEGGGRGEHLDRERLLGEGGEPRIFEAEEPVSDRDEEPGEDAESEAQSDQGRPQPTHQDHAHTDHQTGNGLEEEEGSDGGDGAVAVGLVPEVEVDEGGPDQEEACDHEGGRGGPVEGPARTAGTSEQDRPRRWQRLRREAWGVDAGGSRLHAWGYGRGADADCATEQEKSR